jgi:hypothetical protein
VITNSTDHFLHSRSKHLYVYSFKRKIALRSRVFNRPASCLGAPGLKSHPRDWIFFSMSGGKYQDGKSTWNYTTRPSIRTLFSSLFINHPIILCRKTIIFRAIETVSFLQFLTEKRSLLWSLCLVWGSQDGDCEEYSLLGGNAVWFGDSSKFHTSYHINLLLPISRFAHSSTVEMEAINIRIPPKRRVISKIHGVTSQKTAILCCQCYVCVRFESVDRFHFLQ